jgi:hypothetical protein
MATTTNYGWTTPDDTALVKDGASAIRSLGTSVDTTTKALNPSTTLGDIEYRSSTANTNTRLGIGSTGQVLTVAAGVPSWSALSLSANTTLTAPEEVVNVVASAATGTINVDLATSAYWFYTTDASANFTLNFRGSSGTTLNSTLAVGQSISVVFLNTNGATAYYPTTFQIDGSSITPKWSGGTAPSAGNASSIDAYSFSIIKTAATPTYTVLAGGAVKFA